MSSDIYSILQTGKSALMAQQLCISVTGHNIANANTPGYSRQRVVLGTAEPSGAVPGQIGRGVKATDIERFHDRFLGLQVNDAQQGMARWETQKEALDKVEILFNGTQFSTSMSEFWNAWDDLANNPGGPAERVTLLAKSSQLVEGIRGLQRDLGKIQTDDIAVGIDGKIEEINRISAEIVGLNQKIIEAEAGGQNANDLRDKRDLLLQGLSSQIEVNVFEDNSGQVGVALADGKPLVDKVTAWNLSTNKDADGLQRIMWTDSSGVEFDITDGIRGGGLKGLLEARGLLIDDYMAKVDEIAAGIIHAVNELHRSGYGLTTDAATGAAMTGLDFFTGSSAADMAVNEDLQDDPGKIAASASAEGIPGDNRIAVSISNLRQKATLNHDTATFDAAFEALVSDVGSAVNQAETAYEYQSDMVTHLSEYQESVSGISIDEEMTALLQYQHAYAAAAKLIATVDEMLQVLIQTL